MNAHALLTVECPACPYGSALITEADAAPAVWQCPRCADDEQSDYFARVGDQPRLPLETEPAREPVEVN